MYTMVPDPNKDTQRKAAQSTEPRLDHPMPGQQLMRVLDLDNPIRAGGYNAPEQKFETTRLDVANVVTSRCVDDQGQLTGKHKPILDIDLPVTLVPSTTPGHYHLYIDKELHWHQYKVLLSVLADLGIIEEGFANSSKSRGHTAVRLPWVKKPAPPKPPKAPATWDELGELLAEMTAEGVIAPDSILANPITHVALHTTSAPGDPW